METKRAREPRDRDEKSPYFSCAFCHETSEKPFKICESCGTSQTKDSEEE